MQEQICAAGELQTVPLLAVSYVSQVVVWRKMKYYAKYDCGKRKVKVLKVLKLKSDHEGKNSSR